MAKTEIHGFIDKDKECEYAEYCSKSGARCDHSGENLKGKHYCGYCKSFRMIDEGRLIRGEKSILQGLMK